MISDLPEFDKLVISGSRIDHFSGRLSIHRPSPEAIALGVQSRKLRLALNSPPDSLSLASSVARSRAKLTRLIYSNVFQYRDKHGIIIPPKFLTLTFRRNITSLTEANRYLTRFVASINKHLPDIISGGLKYVCVPEFQVRGAVHFHLVIFNLAFADRIFSRLRRFWPDRFELKTISRDSGVGHICDYIIKYITKQSQSPLFFNKALFLLSLSFPAPCLS